MTIRLLGEYKGNVVHQHRTKIFSFYWGRLKRSKGQMQEKIAFEDTGTRNAPPYILLSSTCEKQVPMDNLSSMKNPTAAHAPELESKNLEAQAELGCFYPLSTDNQHPASLSLQHLPCRTLPGPATSHAIPWSPFRMQVLWLAQELSVPSALL